MRQLTYWNGAAWAVVSLATIPDPIVGEADRGDTLAEIDRALGPALDPLIRRMLPGRGQDVHREIRKEIVNYIGDVLSSEQAAP